MIYYLFDEAAWAFSQAKESWRLYRMVQQQTLKTRIARAVGTPRLKAVVLPRERMLKLTTTVLSAELKRRDIRGRSKARTKTAMVDLLIQKGVTL